MKWKEKFTKVFLINLPHRTDRLEQSTKILNGYGVEFDLWDATPHEDGVMGLLLSMKYLFYHILRKTNIQHCIVLEDDCNFLLDFNDFMNLLVDQLPDNYRMLLLGCTLLGRPTRYSDNLLKIEQSYCTQAICYPRTTIEKIYHLLDHREPYDIKLMREIQSLGNCFCTFPMMCEQFTMYSDIEKGVQDWASYQRITYATYTKGI